MSTRGEAAKTCTSHGTVQAQHAKQGSECISGLSRPLTIRAGASQNSQCHCPISSFALGTPKSQQALSAINTVTWCQRHGSRRDNYVRLSRAIAERCTFYTVGMVYS